MAGTGLATTESTFDVAPRAWDIAEKIARTSSVPPAFRGKPDEIMATILVGHELALSPMTALQQIHVIEGRPTLSAQLMTGVVMSHGHEIWVDESSNNTKVTVCGQRAGSTHVQRVTWTMDDAKAAGLAGKQNWRKYQRQMLTARARAEMCRLLAPDVLAGIAYSREEVEDGFIFDEPTEEETADAPAAGNVRQLAGPKKAAAKKAPAKKAATKKAARPAPAPAAVEDLPPLPGDDEDDGDVVDAEVVDAEVVEEAPADDADAVRRAQQIAMRARDLEVDHHDVVYVVTAGRATSAKGLSEAEFADVMEALRQIKVGEKVLDTTGEEPALLDPPEPEEGDEPGEGPDVGDCETWDGEQWKAWLASMGAKVVPTLREAQRLAGDMGLDAPGSLAGLQGTTLAPLVAAWVLETHGGGR
jgi:hypothetical protein